LPPINAANPIIIPKNAHRFAILNIVCLLLPFLSIRPGRILTYPLYTPLKYRPQRKYLGNPEVFMNKF
jgi:hypothetical protein